MSEAHARLSVIFGWCCCLAANDERVEVDSFAPIG